MNILYTIWNHFPDHLHINVLRLNETNILCTCFDWLEAASIWLFLEEGKWAVQFSINTSLNWQGKRLVKEIWFIERHLNCWIKPNLDLSGKKNQNAEKRSSAARKRLQLRTVAFCFSLILCIHIFLLLLLFLPAILALCTHQWCVTSYKCTYNVFLCEREHQKNVLCQLFLCYLLGMFPNVIEKAAVDTMH